MMKVLIALLCIIGLGLSNGFSQDAVKKSSVPPAVIEEFEARFADAENVGWFRQGDAFYGARFQMLDKNAEVVYSPNGEWVQTEQEIAYLEMPDEARAYCRTHYPDYQAKDVLKVSTRKYGILYEIKISGEAKTIQLIFDMHGKLVDKEEKETEEAEEEGTQPGVKDKLGKLFGKGGNG